MALVVSLHIATGLALIGIASGRLEEAVRKLASQGLMGNELWQAAPRVQVRSSTAFGTGRMWFWLCRCTLLLAWR